MGEQKQLSWNVDRGFGRVEHRERGKCFNRAVIIAIAVMFWRPVAIDVINLLKMTKMYYSLEISCAKTLRTGWSELGGAHMGGGWMAGSPPPTLIIGPSLPLYGSGSKKR